MANDGIVDKLKIELGEIALKDMVLSHFNITPDKDEVFEAYFYLNEEGSPTFVVEQCNVTNGN